MAATLQDISRWFDAGVKQGATHMIVLVDQFDYEDYPKYVMPGEDPRAISRSNTEKPMVGLMEVYDLRLDKAEQLAEHRSFHW